MITGYLALGGQQTAMPLTLPFEPQASGGLSSRSGRGSWALCTDLHMSTVSLPSRSKEIDVFGLGTQSSLIRDLDAEDGENYQAKLRSTFTSREDGVLINRSAGTHTSLAIVAATPLTVVGLHDQQVDHSFLVWGRDEQTLALMLGPNPMRYLLYRFPLLIGPMFLPVETLCAKWWRWTSHGSTLRAFNAMERRLYR